MTLTVGILDTLIRGNCQGSSRCFQVLAAPPLTRLQVTSLRPFVPSVNEQQRTFGYLRSFAVPDAGTPEIHNVTQPPLICFWRRVGENCGALLSSGTIVPGRKYTRNLRIVGR